MALLRLKKLTNTNSTTLTVEFTASVTTSIDVNNFSAESTIDNINSGVYIKYELYDGGEGEIVFYISGRGINGNNPPWNIFIWDGDPDDMQKYEFTKENK
jgi:hypothetical protein